MSVFKPNPDLVGAKRYNCKDDPLLNRYQIDHINGVASVYQPISLGEDGQLPPLSYQWSQDWKRRCRRG